MKPLQIISNCIGVELGVGAHGVISGNRRGCINITQQVNIPYTIKVVSGFSTTSQAGVIVSVCGQLNLAIMYSDSRKAVSVWILNCELIGSDLIGIIDNVLNLKQASILLMDGIVESYYSEVPKHVDINSWVKFNISK